MGFENRGNLRGYLVVARWPWVGFFFEPEARMFQYLSDDLWVLNGVDDSHLALVFAAEQGVPLIIEVPPPKEAGP